MYSPRCVINYYNVIVHYYRFIFYKCHTNISHYMYLPIICYVIFSYYKNKFLVYIGFRNHRHQEVRVVRIYIPISRYRIQ